MIKGIFINQYKYAEETLKKYGMEDCNAVKNLIMLGHKLTKATSGEDVNQTEFKQLVGSMRYLTTTRPDLIYFVNLVSRYMEHPNEHHLHDVKRIPRYVRGTSSMAFYTRDVEDRE